MTNYKAMYFHLAGQIATTIDALESRTSSLVDITENLKKAQLATEEMFMCSEDEYDLDHVE